MVLNDMADINNTKDLGAHLKMGIYYFDRKEYEKSLDVFNRTLELYPADKLAHFKIGEINYRLGRYDEAVSELKKSLKLDGKNKMVYMVLGVLYREKGRYKEAILELNKAFRLSKQDKGFEADIYYEKANAYLGWKKYDMALKEAKKSAQLKPANKYAYRLSGNIYNEWGKHEEAIVELNKALDLSSQDKEFESWVCHGSAIAHLGLKEYGLAMKEAQKAIELNPVNKYACKLLSDIYAQTGRYEEAMSELKKAAGLSEQDPGFKYDVYFDSAKIFLRLAKYDLAGELAKKALSVNAGDKFGHRLAGYISLQMRRFEEALKEFDKALKLSVGNKEFELDIYNDKALIYSEQGKYGQMISQLNKAVKLNSANYKTHWLMAVRYKHQGKYKEALKELIKVMNLSRKDKKLEQRAQFAIIRLAEDVNLEGGKVQELIKKALGLKFPARTMMANSLTNELEIAKKTVRLKSKPRRLIVSVTNQCNLDCQMCLNQKIPKLEIPDKMKRKIKDSFKYLESINWMGGEAFLYPGFKELVYEAAKYPLLQEITTNALLIDEATAGELIENNVSLIISIDAVTKEVYESVQKGASYELLIKKLKMLRDLIKRIDPEYKLTLNTVVLRSNYRQIEAFVEFAKAYNFSVLNFMKISENRNNENIFDYDPDPAILSYVGKALDNARETCKKYGISFHTNITNDMLKTSKTKKKNNKVKVLCLEPWKNLHLDASGAVCTFIDPSCKEIVGNLNDKSLDEIWNGDKIINYRCAIAEGN